MLDLVFLILLLYVFIYSLKGIYKETACNIALVVGIIAGFVGCIQALLSDNDVMVTLNLIVIVMAFGLRFAARKLVNLYHEKEIAEAEAREHDRWLHSRTDDRKRDPVYTDDNFDDEELRFGKGGYTDPKL